MGFFSILISRGRGGLVCFEGDFRDICIFGILREFRSLGFILLFEGLCIDR